MTKIYITRSHAPIDAYESKSLINELGRSKYKRSRSQSHVDSCSSLVWYGVTHEIYLSKQVNINTYVKEVNIQYYWSKPQRWVLSYPKFRHQLYIQTHLH